MTLENIEQTDRLIRLLIEVGQELLDNDKDPEQVTTWALYEYIEAIRGIKPSQYEIDEIYKEILQKDNLKKYTLCDIQTGEPVDNLPPLWYNQCEINHLENYNETFGKYNLIAVSQSDLEEHYAEQERKRAAEQELRRDWLNNDERAALKRFAQTNGKLWRARLLSFWWDKQAIPMKRGSYYTCVYDPNDAGILIKLATARYFGPDTLTKYKLPFQV